MYLEATVICLGFVTVLFAGSAMLPARVHHGAVLADGTRKRYPLNGLLLFGIVLVGCLVLAVFAPSALAVPYHLLWELFVVANIFALVAAVALWWRGHGERSYANLFYGVELNPSLLGVDLKMFSYRPSLIGLFVLNVSYAAAQWELHGQLSARMLLYQLFCLVYVGNYFWFEHGMLHTWDIIAERFGGGLIWGDYVLVPFFYGIAGLYLVDDLRALPVWEAAGLGLLFALGMWLFRGANGQKHRVKADPSARIWGRQAQLLEGKLLVSGFWGIGRKLNYTGEVLVYLAWTLLCGWQFVPYLLPLWLAGLLAHRAWRDERRCKAKYGRLWENYCRHARFRMVPYIY